MEAVAVSPPFWAAALAAAEAAITATASAGAAVVGAVASGASTVIGTAALVVMPVSLGPEIAISGGSLLAAGAGAGTAAAAAGAGAAAAGGSAIAAAGAGAAAVGGSVIAAAAGGSAIAAAGAGAAAAGGSVIAAAAGGSSLAAGVLGGIQAAAVIAGLVNSHSQESTLPREDTDAPPAASRSGPSNGGSDSDSDSDDEKASDSFDDRPRLDKPILIPKNRMKDLLNAFGKDMYEKLTEVISDDQRKIWSNLDFRIDAGHHVHNRPNFKTWNLQVNHNPQSHAAKELLKKHGTHAKLIWDTIDPKNTPDYRTWVEGVLKLFNE